jgi:23S rRNA pseudouridine1911/1915/1917 synthase
MKLIQQQFIIDDHTSGMRLDQAVCAYLPDYSRSKIQDWIRQGFILHNDVIPKPKLKVYIGDVLQLDIPPTTIIYDPPQKIRFDIIYQDEHIFVINKPAGLVVHPAAGHDSGTLLNGLLFLDPALEQLPRAGIVHRLDKETSGVMMVARTLTAHAALVEALQARDIKREYLAVAQGVITAGRTIDEPITRHPVDRKRMSVQQHGKPAVTHFQVKQRFRAYTLIDVQLETGRTHQIRVHMAHIRHPLLGDPVYGGRLAIPANITPELEQLIRRFKRQALHAWRLSFAHPVTSEAVSFTADIPADMAQLIEGLKHDATQ